MQIISTGALDIGCALQCFCFLLLFLVISMRAQNEGLVWIHSFILPVYSHGGQRPAYLSYIFSIIADDGLTH